MWHGKRHPGWWCRCTEKDRPHLVLPVRVPPRRCVCFRPFPPCSFLVDRNKPSFSQQLSLVSKTKRYRRPKISSRLCIDNKCSAPAVNGDLYEAPPDVSGGISDQLKLAMWGSCSKHATVGWPPSQRVCICVLSALGASNDSEIRPVCPCVIFICSYVIKSTLSLISRCHRLIRWCWGML
jgi:hypothetical protein